MAFHQQIQGSLAPWLRSQFLLSFFQQSCYFGLSRLTMRGERVVTIARRDAVDASGIVRRAMRAADGEVAWSWHPWAGAKLARR